MTRWQPDARGRLQQAALSLYGERGYDRTTVAEIAEHAGLTKRTFFRYFADKREVLFAGSAEFTELIVSAVIAAPESAAPLDAVAAGLAAAADMFEQMRDAARQRQHIIAANPELQERELTKLASLADAVAGGLRRRGVGDPAAALTAQAGVAVFRVAFQRWVDQAGSPLPEVIREALEELRAVTGSSAP